MSRAGIRRVAVARVILGLALVQLSAVAGARLFGDSTADIVKFEEAFTAAIGRNDVAALEGYLSDDWSIVSGGGVVIDRSTFLKVMAGGDLVHQSMAPQGQNIRRYGQVAVVTARIQSGGTYRGVGFHTDEISTDVIVKVHGHWVCVLTQLTAVTPQN